MNERSLSATGLVVGLLLGAVAGSLLGFVAGSVLLSRARPRQSGTSD